MLLIIFASVFIFVLGYLAQTSGLCLVRGVNEAMAKRPQFLIAILLSGSSSWAILYFAQFNSIAINELTTGVTITMLIGGALFGIGTALNGGCSVSTVSKLVRGQCTMVFTIIGWLLAWQVGALVEFDIDSRASENYFTFLMPLNQRVLILLFVSLIILSFVLFTKTANKALWATMLVIGILAGFIFLVEPHWSPSSVLKSLSNGFRHGGTLWPNVAQLILVFSLVLGMFSAAIYTKSFVLEPGNVKSYFKHSFAGALMGAGAWLAGGGNDFQILVAMPTLSLGSVLVVLCMLAGIYITLKLVQPKNTC